MHHDKLARAQWEDRRDDPCGIKGVVTGFALCLALCSPLFVLVIFF